MNTEAIRTIHRELLEGIEILRVSGDRISADEPTLSAEAAAQALGFLRERLIPHARTEARFVWPEVGRLLNSTEATRSMIRDHFEVARLCRDLEGAIEAREFDAMRRLLYGLYHVILLHVAKEEEAYLPVLDERLSPGDMLDLLRRMSLEPVR